MGKANGVTKNDLNNRNTTTTDRGSGPERSEPWPFICEWISELTLTAARSGVSGSRERSGAFGLAARARGEGARISGQDKKRNGAATKESSRGSLPGGAQSGQV